MRSKKYMLFALAPVFVAPLAIMLFKRDKADFLFGLSSDFYAGALVGLSICAAMLAIVMMTRSRQIIN